MIIASSNYSRTQTTREIKLLDFTDHRRTIFVQAGHTPLAKGRPIDCKHDSTIFTATRYCYRPTARPLLVALKYRLTNEISSQPRDGLLVFLYLTPASAFSDFWDS